MKKENWEIKKLGEVCDIYDKKRQPISKKNRIKGIYPYYGATGIQDYINKYLFDGEYLLIGEDGAKWEKLDKTAYIVKGKFWVNNHAHIIHLNFNLSYKFVEYYLYYKDLSSFIKGAVVPKLTQDSLKQIPIPIPSLSEQQKIVGFLDSEFEKIDEIKANAEKNLENAKSLFQAELSFYFNKNKKNWEYISFENCIKSIQLKKKILKKDYLSNGLYPIISQEEELVSGYWNDEEDVIKLDKPIIVFGDHTKVIKYIDFDFVLGADGVKVLYPIDKLYSRFFMYSLQSHKLPNLGYARHYKLLKELIIPIPSLQDQQQIVDKLDGIMAKCTELEEVYSKTCEECDALKEALLRGVFDE